MLVICWIFRFVKTTYLLVFNLHAPEKFIRILVCYEHFVLHETIKNDLKEINSPHYLIWMD